MSTSQTLIHQSRRRNVNREQPPILRGGSRYNWNHEDSLPQFNIHLSGHLLVLARHCSFKCWFGAIENQFAAILQTYVYSAQILMLIHFIIISKLTFLPQTFSSAARKFMTLMSTISCNCFALGFFCYLLSIWTQQDVCACKGLT